MIKDLKPLSFNKFKAYKTNLKEDENVFMETFFSEQRSVKEILNNLKTKSSEEIL
jgi:hypothetical protein